MRGPRDGFTEMVKTNISLVRQRLRTPDLRIITRQRTSKRGHEDLIIAYVEGVVDPEIVAEVNRRLDMIEKGTEPAEIGDLKISGTALFQADRLVGTLGPAETRGLLWLRDQVQSRTPITVSLGNEQFLTYLALRTTSDLKPEQAGQDIRMHVQVKAEGNIVDYTPDLILDPSRISAIEKKLAEEIRNDVLAAWKKTVSLRADTGGFGVHVHRYYPRLWRGLKPTWRSQGFPSVQLSVEADVTVLRTGIVEPVHKKGAP